MLGRTLRGATPPHFFDKPSVKIELVGKITVIIISFDKDTLVGSRSEIIFYQFEQKHFGW